MSEPRDTGHEPALVLERLARIEARLKRMPTTAGLVLGGLALAGAITGAVAVLLFGTLLRM